MVLSVLTVGAAKPGILTRLAPGSYPFLLLVPKEPEYPRSTRMLPHLQKLLPTFENITIAAGPHPLQIPQHEVIFVTHFLAETDSPPGEEVNGLP